MGGITPPTLNVVDSSVWIPYLRRSLLAPERTKVEQLLREQTVVMAGVVLMEVLGGARNDDEWKVLADLFLALEVLSTPAGMWWDTARLQYRLARKGVAVPLGDIIVATLAIRNDCVLIHADRHFDLIARHSRLRAERLC